MRGPQTRSDSGTYHTQYTRHYDDRAGYKSALNRLVRDTLGDTCKLWVSHICRHYSIQTDRWVSCIQSHNTPPDNRKSWAQYISYRMDKDKGT